MKGITLKVLSLLLCLSLTLPLAVSCGKTEAPETKPETVPETEAPTAVWALADLGNDVNIHTAEQKDAWSIEYPNDVKNTYKGDQALSAPRPVLLSWTCDCNEPSEFVSYRVTVFESKNPEEIRTYTVAEPKAAVYNLKIATDYDWKVTAVYENAEYTSESAHFRIADEVPRNLYVEGVENVRDIGGYVTVSGQRVRQGMMIRCGRLNESAVDELVIEITEEGKRVMSEELKIKTEIDLRKVENNEVGCLTESPIPGANYVSLPMDASKTLISDPYNYDNLLTFFEMAADESNYPMAFHCNIGTDRTGALAYLVLMILGVDYDTICREYAFSNLAKIGSSRDLTMVKRFNTVTKKIDGETENERICNYLLQLGVTEEQMNSLRRIMLEPQA